MCCTLSAEAAYEFANNLPFVHFPNHWGSPQSGECAAISGPCSQLSFNMFVAELLLGFQPAALGNLALPAFGARLRPHQRPGLARWSFAQFPELRWLHWAKPLPGWWQRDPHSSTRPLPKARWSFRLETSLDLSNSSLPTRRFRR